MSGSDSTTIDGCDLTGKVTDAAVKVQKLFRGNRTRRELADSILMADEHWSVALEYAKLRRTTISFFDSTKPESPTSRWSRIISHASKVGKGLSKDDKAQQLIFQHWIEAIDPKHRYGKNLQVYYNEWCKTDESQPFFYWLDIGAGKDLDLEKCPRSKLKDHCVKYLCPKGRERYEYIIVDGKIINKLSGDLLHTNISEDGWDAGMLFVISTCKKLYVGEKKRGKFHHSSFLSGGATIVAGALVAEHGILKSLAPFTGHYKTSDERLQSILSYFKDNGVNVDDVQIRKASEYFNFPEDKSFKRVPSENLPKTNVTTGEGISAA